MLTFALFILAQTTPQAPLPDRFAQIVLIVTTLASVITAILKYLAAERAERRAAVAETTTGVAQDRAEHEATAKAKAEALNDVLVLGIEAAKSVIIAYAGREAWEKARDKIEKKARDAGLGVALKGRVERLTGGRP